MAAPASRADRGGETAMGFPGRPHSVKGGWALGLLFARTSSGVMVDACPLQSYCRDHRPCSTHLGLAYVISLLGYGVIHRW